MALFKHNLNTQCSWFMLFREHWGYYFNQIAILSILLLSIHKLPAPLENFTIGLFTDSVCIITFLRYNPFIWQESTVNLVLTSPFNLNIINLKKYNFLVRCFELNVNSVMEIVPILVCISLMFPSWCYLYSRQRNTCVWRLRLSTLHTKESTCVWQLRVIKLHTKEHLCLTVEGVYIVY